MSKKIIHVIQDEYDSWDQHNKNEEAIMHLSEMHANGYIQPL